MAREGTMVEKQPTDELRETEREKHNCCPVCGAQSDQFRQLIDIVSQSVTEAVLRTIQEGQGLPGKITAPAGTAGRQSTFVSDEQWVKDRVLARQRENHTRVQWRDIDHRGRSGKGAG